MKEIIQVVDFHDTGKPPAATKANELLASIDAKDVELIQRYPGHYAATNDYVYGGILVAFRKRVPEDVPQYKKDGETK